MIEYGWARRDEEEELLDFANYVFSAADKPVDFRRLLPKVYEKPGFSEISVVAREGGRIKALANAVHGELRVGDEKLSWGYVGTVCVHPYMRGRGMMKRVVPMVMDSCARQGCQFIALSGERQLYRQFGFEDAGSLLSLNLTKASLSAARKGGIWDSFQFVKLEEAGEDALAMAVRLHAGLGMAAIREKPEFITVLKSWQGQPYAVMREGEPFGYLYRVGGCIPEFALQDNGAAPSVFASFLEREGLDEAQVSPCLFDMPRYTALFQASDSFEIKPSCMIRVLDWKGFIGALLKLQGSIARLIPGKAVLAIGEEARLLITVDDKGTQVQESNQEADLNLDPQAAVRLLSHPLSQTLYPDHPFANWFPLPFQFPRADMF